MRKLYLDIDGVLITSKNPINVPHGIDDFIRYITSNFDCYWLTTHCHSNPEECIRYLKPYFTDDILALLSRVKPTNWNTLKTEAINLCETFFWLDDHPMIAEKRVLEAAEKSECLITVNLSHKYELNRIVNILKS